MMSSPSAVAAAESGATRQFSRFAAVGVFSNLVLYAAYLSLSGLGMPPKLAMALVYVAGVAGTYLLNNNWTFGLSGLSKRTFTRYIGAQCLGFLFNLALQWALVDHLHWPHQWVQALAIVLVATLLFGLNRYWVFARAAGGVV